MSKEPPQPALPFAEILVPLRAPRVRHVECCPLCGGADSAAFLAAHDRLYDVRGEYRYRRCRSCRTVFQDPMVVPADLSACYPIEYYTHAPPEGCGLTSASDSSSALRRARSALRDAVKDCVRGEPARGSYQWLARILARSRVIRERSFRIPDELIPRGSRRRALDVGCGSGALMLDLMLAGWSIDGVEPDPRAAEVARRLTGCTVHQEDLFQAPLPLACFDLVVLNHVIEHLPDPEMALRRLTELLAPSGRLVLIYPNPDSLLATLYAGRWLGWDVPRHLVIPPLPSLVRLSARWGLAAGSARSFANSTEVSTNSALSRALRAGRRPDVLNPHITALDRGLAILERVLMSVGFSCGEEAILVLRKDQ